MYVREASKGVPANPWWDLPATARAAGNWRRFWLLVMFFPAATVGVVTETNAEKAIEELKAYEADVATVLRDGRWAVVPATGELGLLACA